MKKQKKLWDILIFIFLAVGAIVMLYPFVWMVCTSFKPKMHVYLDGLLPKVWDFSSYIQIWNEIPLVRGFLNTMLYSIPPVIIGSLVSVGAAFAFSSMMGRDATTVLSVIMVMQSTFCIMVSAARGMSAWVLIPSS